MNDAQAVAVLQRLIDQITENRRQRREIGLSAPMREFLEEELLTAYQLAIRSLEGSDRNA